MQSWIETLAVTVVCILALVLGLRISRLRKPYWLFGYALPLAVIVGVGLARNINRLRFVPVFRLINAGRNEFAVMAFVIPMLFGILIPRLRIRNQKIWMFVLLAVSSTYFVIYPFFAPILVYNKLKGLETIVLSDGICLQNTGYTCGPAAAVTALGQFRIKANEGELAILARTTPQMGTPDDMLASAIEKRYGDLGIRCRYRYFKSVEQLKQACPTIAVVKFALLVDHYVTVLQVTDREVVIGDPLEGRRVLTYEEFQRKWRSIGITVEKIDNNNSTSEALP